MVTLLYWDIYKIVILRYVKEYVYNGVKGKLITSLRDQIF